MKDTRPDSGGKETGWRAGARLATASLWLSVGNNGGGCFDARRSPPECFGLKKSNCSGGSGKDESCPAEAYHLMGRLRGRGL